MIGRPAPVLILAALALLAGIASLIVTLQFLEIIPWGEEDLEFWGGKWAGVLLYGFSAFLGFLVCFGWLTLKPWALMITLFAALLGFSVPMMSFLAGTETFSTAVVPMLLFVAIIFMAMRPSVRQAVANATALANAPKPPPRPRGFRSEEV